jgi:hypothetical protein
VRGAWSLPSRADGGIDISVVDDLGEVGAPRLQAEPEEPVLIGFEARDAAALSVRGTCPTCPVQRRRGEHAAAQAEPGFVTAGRSSLGVIRKF